MNWTELTYDLGYVVVAFLAVYLSGWLIYDKLATARHSLAKALFEERNLAAGLEISAFLFVEILIAVSALSGPEVRTMDLTGTMVTDYFRDLEAVAVTIIFSNLTFFLFRFIASWTIKTVFRGKIDPQGDAVSFNNEIFQQKNFGAALFSLSYLLIMYFMILQEDFLGDPTSLMQGYLNMAGVLVLGLAVYFIHDFFFMDRGHSTLQELFLDNNPAVGLSLTGFMFTVLFLQNRLMEQFGPQEHFFGAGSETYVYLLLVLAFILIFRKCFTVLVSILTKRNFQAEFLEEDNPVAGLMDLSFIASSGLLLGVLL